MLINANAVRIPLADESVHCSVMSIPYYLLRDYGVGGQLGSERTPDEYINNISEVFKEVYRVCRPDSTVWLNVADTMSGSAADRAAKLYNESKSKLLKEWGYRDKEELDIPHRLRQALRRIGFYGRITNIWHKPNPMPESVTDRPTKAHEYLFLLTKSARYFYDADAVREGNTTGTIQRLRSGARQPIGANGTKASMARGDKGGEYSNPAGRNRRTVWTIATAPYSGAHFATFPPALVEPCIKAGTSEHGCCPACGAPWARVKEQGFTSHDANSETLYRKGSAANRLALLRQAARKAGGEYSNNSVTIDWRPTCECRDDVYMEAIIGGRTLNTPIPCTVFDPFVGSGTTVMVARALGRKGIGLDLSMDYLHLARERLSLDKLEAWSDGLMKSVTKKQVEDLPLFGGEP